MAVRNYLEVLIKQTMDSIEPICLKADLAFDYLFNDFRYGYTGVSALLDGMEYIKSEACRCYGEMSQDRKDEEQRLFFANRDIIAYMISVEDVMQGLQSPVYDGFGAYGKDKNN